MRTGKSDRNTVHGILTCLVVCSGCTSTTIVEPFFRPEGSQVQQVYVSPGADFGVYAKLMATPLEIYYPDNAPAPTEAEIERLRQIFREAFLTEIGDDYEIVTEPGPDVMRVLAQIIDLKVLGPLGTFEASGRLREVVTKGQLTLLMEFQDSVTDRVLARVGEAEEGDSTAITAEESSWTEVEVAAKRWAGLFRTFLDENFGRQNVG